MGNVLVHHRFGAKRLRPFGQEDPSGNFNRESGLARLNRGATNCSSRVHLRLGCAFSLTNAEALKELEDEPNLETRQNARARAYAYGHA